MAARGRCHQQPGDRACERQDRTGSHGSDQQGGEEALDGLPPVKVHCSLLAEEAIHAALWDYAEKHGIKIEGLQKPKNDISEGEEAEEEEY